MKTGDVDAACRRVYSERNALAVAFAKAALAAGWKAGRGYDNREDKGWDPEWRHTVYVELPTGEQVSWHIASAEVPLLDTLPPYDGEWDGTFVGRDTRWPSKITPLSAQPVLKVVGAKPDTRLEGIEGSP